MRFKARNMCQPCRIKEGNMDKKTVIFALLGSALVKVESKTLVKLIPGLIYFANIFGAKPSSCNVNNF